jgi:hypothetical protein
MQYNWIKQSWLLDILLQKEKTMPTNQLLGVQTLLISHALHIEMELEVKLVCCWCFGS